MALRKQEKLTGMGISDTSITQPVFVTMLMLLVVTFGLLSYRTLPVNLLPDFEVAVEVVSISYPGAGPESVTEQVVKPVENVVNTINGIKHITSTASDGQAIIRLDFVEGTNLEKADRDIREKVSAIRNTLPRDIREPLYQRFDPNSAPILTVAVAGKTGQSPLELRRLVEDEIVPQIERAPGVGSTTISGGLKRQINVQMDLNKLSAYGILPSQISRSLQQANTNLGLGSITVGQQDISLRAPSMLQTPQDIGDIQITGTSYRVSDVATVTDGVADTKTYARLNGSDAILIAVRKQSGTNTVSVADAVKVQLGRAFKDSKDATKDRQDLTYSIPSDSSTSVVSSTISSLEELIFSSVAALLVVMFFFSGLRNVLVSSLLPALVLLIGFVVLPAAGMAVNKAVFLGVAVMILIVMTFFRDRNTLVTMAGLPIILAGTFAMMPVFGLTINLITLLALSLCVGLVIDDAIVVRENIFRHTQRGESPRIAASKGTAEVSLSVLAMTLTVVAVFLPVTFTSGTTGIIFKSFGLTISAAILLSLVEAFMFAPMLSANLFKRSKAHDHHSSHERPEIVAAVARLRAEGNEQDASLISEANEDTGRFGRFYERLLELSLRSTWSRLAVVALAIVVLVGSFGVARGLKFQFFPVQDQHQFVMGFELPPGTTLSQTKELALKAEQVMLADREVTSVISNIGFSGNAERAEFTVQLDDHTPTLDVQERLRPQLGFLPKVSFSAPSFQGSSTAVTGRTVQFSIQSTETISTIGDYALKVTDVARSVPGLIDVDTNYQPGKPELIFNADPTRIGALGITNDDIAVSVRALVNGDTATVLRQNGTDTDVVVRLRSEDRSSTDALRNIVVPTRGGSVPLTSLGQAQIDSSPITIQRYDRLNQAIVGANLANGININDATAALLNKIKQQTPPPTTMITGLVGTAQQQQDGFGSLFLAMGLSVLFVYMVLASQFGSFTQPLIIMMAMPFSFIGAFLALRLTNIPLDITGMIGLILLLGLVVKNSILLVDFTNRLRRAGLAKNTAIQVAGAIRLRPILMTTMALVAGSLPVAIGIHLVGTGQGSEFRRGLAVVLIGGLLTSVLLTLLVVPTVYSLLEGLTERLTGAWSRRFNRDEEMDEADEPLTAPAPVPAMAPAIAPRRAEVPDGTGAAE